MGWLDRFQLIFFVLSLALGVGACAFSPDASSRDNGEPGVDAGDGEPGGGDDAGGDSPDGDPPDRDDDGIADSLDNCPDAHNVQQYDEDGDAVGDACDNCPGAANLDQSDQGEIDSGETADGVGDACDPRPNAGGDSIAHFDGFNGTTLDPRWQSAQGGGTWQVEGGVLRQTDTSSTASMLLYFNGANLPRAAIDTLMVYDDVPPPSPQTSRFRAGGVVGHYGMNGIYGTGYSCEQIQDYYQGDDNDLHILLFNSDSLSSLSPSRGISQAMAEGVAYSHRFILDGPGRTMTCQFDGATINGSLVKVQSHSSHRSGFLGLRTFAVAAVFRFAVIYSLGGSP